MMLGSAIVVPCVLFLLWAAVVTSSNGSYLFALMMVAPSVFLASLLWCVGRARLVVTPKSFEVTGLWGRPVVGQPSDFIGYDYNEVRHSWDLLRRDDLSIVRVPRFTHGGRDDVVLRSWLDRHFARAECRQLSRIERDSHMAEQQTLRVLEETQYEKSALLDQVLDTRLAAAARSAWRYRYGQARPALQRHMVELPPRSIATQYVVDALRRIGNAESVEVMLEDLRRHPGQRQAIARAVSELATSDHRRLLEAFSQDDDAFVRHHAERALGRIDTGDVKARSRTRSPAR
jgi:hypothetical protein